MQVNSNKNNNNFKANNLPKALNTFYNPNATLPSLLIETGVTVGRSMQAYKRGGKVEASERLVEQGISALVWIYGVQIIKKAGEYIGEKLFHLDLNFDVGRDILRNPIKNNNIDPKRVCFKVGNILGSAALATYFIGFVLPKINHKISSSIAKKQSKQQAVLRKKPISFNEYKNKTKNNISFTSLLDKGVSLAHTLENNQTMRLFITDSGVVAGRYANSRNKYEKIESLFRDISSIYFYLASTKHIKNILNTIMDNTDIDPKTLGCVTEKLKQQIQTHGIIDKNSLYENAIGNIGSDKTNILNQLFKEKKTVTVEEFTQLFPTLQIKAENMAKLQPVFNSKGVLTYQEATDVIKQGWLCDGEFLKNTFEKVTDGASSDKLRFVSSKKLENIRNSIDKFITQMQKQAQKSGTNIDANFIEKVAKQNMVKNLTFNIIGTAISTFVLATVIPKIQYKITEILKTKNNSSINREKENKTN